MFWPLVDLDSESTFCFPPVEGSDTVTQGRRQDLGLGGFQFKCSVDLFPLYRRRRSQKIS